MLPSQHVELLKQFVTLARNDPAILNSPELAFYRDYLASLGAKVPTTDTSSKESSNNETTNNENNSTPSQSYEEQEEDPEIPYPELDNTGVIPEDNEEELSMGDNNKEVTDEDLEKANEERDLANAAFSEGNYEESLKHYTAAIDLNSGSALLHAKRANVLLKLSKPVAAIRDCNKAISINPDSAQGYKFRGRAYRLLGKWVEAHKDLATACKIDYDDTAAEWLKEVEPNAKKLQEYNRAKERRLEEKELRERRERVRRAQEANRRAAEEAAEAGDDGSSEPGINFADFLKDPELMKLLQEDPSLMTKLADVMQNPQNIAKYMGDPSVSKFIKKMASGMGGGGGGFPFGGSPGGGAGGFPFGGAASGNPFDAGADAPPPYTPNAEPGQPKKAPEPDLD